MIFSYESFCERLEKDGEVEKLAKFKVAYAQMSGIPRDIFLLDSIAYYLGIPVNDGSPEWCEYVISNDKQKWKQDREKRLKKEQAA